MGVGGVVLPMLVPAPCSMLIMVRAGTSFVEGFVVIAEAIVSASTESGGSCGTDFFGLCPPIQVCQSRTQVGGFHREGMGGGAPHLEYVVVLQQTRVV